MKKINEIIKNKREELNLSIRKAAEKIGISHSYLTMIEKGNDPRTKKEIKITPETIKLISKAYKIDYDELMEAAGYIEKNSNEKFKITEDEKKIIETYRSLNKQGKEIIKQQLDLVKEKYKKNNSISDLEKVN